MEKTNVSFSFARVKKQNFKASKDLELEEKEVNYQEKQLLISVEEKELKGASTSAKEDKKHFVIPLIGTNRWRVRNVANDTKTSETQPEEPEDDIEKQAAQEILRDLADAEYKATEQRVVPLLVQNKVPEGYETDDRLDVSLRPNEEDVNYEEIPIAEFGMAMLRGMGWKENTDVKDKSKQPQEVVARPKGLGLGANRKTTQQMSYTPGGGDSNQKDSEKLTLCKGAYCVVVKGKHQDLYGQVEGLDMENSRVIIKMSLSGKTVTISEFSLKLVTKDEYKKYSKYLNKGKSDKYKEKESDKEKGGKDNGENGLDNHSENHHSSGKHSEHSKTHKSGSKQHDRHSKTHRDSGAEDGSSLRKRRHENDDDRSVKERRQREPANDRATLQQLWVRPHLRVRIVDDRYKKGRYYKEKVTVEDIASIDCCVCRTDDGKVLQDLSQDQLETVVPRNQPAYVMIVSGNRRTEIAELLKKDKGNYQATVQLLSDRDTVLVMSYDDICEYTGDVSHEMDF